ncbi:MAG TPA: LysR family transcriptional regulator, partial [Casimicrobiaceae bacterium]|nr:LysR family transcriptional regulator [Casimicrobiaceae bacterium]
MRNIDIDLVRSFVAIADTGSFTAAGERVSRTQSAVSVQIRRLEETVGQKLLERTTRSIELTREGETFLAYARRMLELNDESIRKLSAPELAGAIRLGILEYFVPDDLPAILARFARAFPGVELEARMGLSVDLREHLAAGRLDAAIVRVSRRDRTKPFWKESQVWVTGGSGASERRTPLPLVL